MPQTWLYLTTFIVTWWGGLIRDRILWNVGDALVLARSTRAVAGLGTRWSEALSGAFTRLASPYLEHGKHLHCPLPTSMIHRIRINVATIPTLDPAHMARAPPPCRGNRAA